MANAGVGAAHVEPPLRQGGQRAGGDRFHLRPRGALLFVVDPFHAEPILAHVGHMR